MVFPRSTSSSLPWVRMTRLPRYGILPRKRSRVMICTAQYRTNITAESWDGVEAWKRPWKRTVKRTNAYNRAAVSHTASRSQQWVGAWEPSKCRETLRVLYSTGDPQRRRNIMKKTVGLIIPLYFTLDKDIIFETLFRFRIRKTKSNYFCSFPVLRNLRKAIPVVK